MRFVNILFFIFYITSLLGQERIISGVVTSSKGESVPYASIYEKEQNIGVSTDVDGNFSIQLTKGKVDLIVTAYGFSNSFFSDKIHNDTCLNIVLTILEDILDEVVDITRKYQGRCDRSKVLPSSFWNKARATAAASDEARIEER